MPILLFIYYLFEKKEIALGYYRKLARYRPDIIRPHLQLKLSQISIQTSRVLLSFSLKVDNHVRANSFAVYSTLRLKCIDYHNLNSSTCVNSSRNN